MDARSSLPPELVERVLERVPPLEFLRALCASCRKYSFDWYTGRLFSHVLVVPDEANSLNVAINRLATLGACGATPGLVLLRPGTYSESVRVTQNCHILGLGARGRVVVEAPGWESALVFAGLGGKNVPLPLGYTDLITGEDACVENITFRCRNYDMRGRCVYIVMGRPLLCRCDIDGGLLVCGHSTAPFLRECRVGNARGTGIHFTDRSRASLRQSVVERHGRHGILVDRRAQPEIAYNTIRHNAACGIRLAGVSRPQAAQSKDGGGLRPGTRLCGNDFASNGGESLSMTPRYVDEAEGDGGLPGRGWDDPIFSTE